MWNALIDCCFERIDAMRLPHMNRMGAAILPLGLALLFPATTLAQSDMDKALKEELRFISALIDSPYASFAQDVIDAAKKTFPTAGGQLEAPALRAKLRTGRYDEVVKIIEARPDKDSFDTWTLKMELAASYYASKDYTKADELYKAFFNKFKTVQAAQKSVYESAVYYYIDMLKRLDRETETFPLYEAAMKNASSEDSKKTFRASYLNALLAEAEKAYEKGDKAAGDKHCKTAEKLASEMLWVQDIYFGDAINAKAHLAIMRGDISGAQTLMNDYLEMLTRIHDQLKETDPTLLRISPLPKCRYLLGSMMYRLATEEISKAGGKVDKNSAPGKKVLDLLLGERNPKTKKRNQQGALYHCANVFMNYPESESADGAITICDEITKILEEHYKTKINITADAETRANVRRQKFVNADVLFSNNQFVEAYDAYQKIIAAEKDPYTLDMMGSLMKVIKASIYIDNEKMKEGKISAADRNKEAKELIKKFAENYAKPDKKNCSANAGQALGELADFCAQNGLADLRAEVEGYFFNYYGNDASAMARKLKRAQEIIGTSKNKTEIEKAVADLQDIIKNASEDQRDTRKDALFLVLDAYKRKDSPLCDNTLRAKTANELVAHFKDVERPGYYAAVAVFERGNAFVDLGIQLRREFPAGTDAAKDAQIAKVYAAAAQVFQGLVDELKKGKETSKFITAEKEAEDVKPLQESAMYLIPFCLQRKNDIDAALKGYEAYLATYPKGDYAPKVLLQMGTMYTSMGEEGIKKSQELLTRLQTEFKSSPEAQNAIPLLAEALTQMGYRDQAVAKYREMFKSGAGYTAAQYLNAARQLFDVKDYALTIEAADALLAAKDATSILKGEGMDLRTRALMLMGSKTKDATKIAEARKQADAYLELVGKTKRAVEVHRLIVDLAAHEMAVATTADERSDIIKRAQASEKFIANNNVKLDPDTRKPVFDKNGVKMMKDVVISGGKIVENPPLITAETSTAVAALAKAAYESLDDKDEKREAMLGSAMNAYYTAMHAIDIAGMTEEDALHKDNKQTVSAIIQEAYLQYLKLAVERRKMADEARNADDRSFYAGEIDTVAKEYKTKFKDGIYKGEIENIQIGNTQYLSAQ